MYDFILTDKPVPIFYHFDDTIDVSHTKRSRGRPKHTHTHTTRSPSLYNLFVQTTIKTLDHHLTNNDKMKECARLWRLHHNNQHK